jgi:hypothetical protein
VYFGLLGGFGGFWVVRGLLIQYQGEVVYWWYYWLDGEDWPCTSKLALLQAAQADE